MSQIKEWPPSPQHPNLDQGNWRLWLVPCLLVLVSGCTSYILLTHFGLFFMVVGLGAALVAAVLVRISIHDLSFAMIGWFLSMGPMRSVGMVTMPGLPDFSIDRIMLVWIIGILILRVIMGKDRLDGPYTGDILIFGHTIYIWLQMQLMDDVSHFHEWVLSSLSPFFAFIYGKYVVRDEKFIRNILVFFVFLTVGFYIVAIAEHFHWNALIWPKSILDPDVGFWTPGRSRGPMLHAPLFGQILAILLMVHFYFLLKVRHIGLKLTIMVSLLLTLLAEFFAYTRGPWIAAAVGFTILGTLRPGYRKALGILAIMAVLGGTLGLMQLANDDFFQDRINAQNTIENRLGFLANAVRMIKDHPFFGIGFFRYMDTVGLYNQTAYIPFYGMVKKDLSDDVPIHDIYLGRTAEEGFVGMFFMVAFYLVIFRAWVSLWRQNSNYALFNKDLLALFGSMMVCYLVGGMVIDYRYFDFINAIFFFQAGILYGFHVRLGKKGVGPRLPVGVPWNRSIW